ncbi:hypothetical protein [Clostridium rectalis]|uniref:hypothetical protein n=1 Tax=Clostridium rectalis TaxID=2040295 RepID=UPI000F63DED5|nr:hypothetical protein [Clostridium rectalis]
MILILSFLIGSVFSKIFIKDTANDTAIKTENVVNKEKDKNEIIKSNKTFKYLAIQGGIFQNDNNANEVYKILQSYGSPFIIQDNKYKRVFLGIYSENQGNKIMKSLENKKIDNSKMTFVIEGKDICDLEIGEIINAYIQILNKLGEKDVKSIETKEFKKWCSELEKIQGNKKNIQVLNEIKGKIKTMPETMSKEKISENYIFLYSVLKKIKN